MNVLESISPLNYYCENLLGRLTLLSELLIMERFSP